MTTLTETDKDAEPRWQAEMREVQQMIRQYTIADNHLLDCQRRMRESRAVLTGRLAELRRRLGLGVIGPACDQPTSMPADAALQTGAGTFPKTPFELVLDERVPLKPSFPYTPQYQPPRQVPLEEYMDEPTDAEPLD